MTQRVGPPHRPDPAWSSVRWGRQPGYVAFSGKKVAVTRPRVRTREGEEVALDSYARLQHDGRRQRAVREGIVAGLTSWNYHRMVQSVLEGYGIEKSSVSREFVAASAPQPKRLGEKQFGELDLVAILIDGNGTAGGRKEIPEGQRLRGTGSTPSQTESLVDSTGPGRVTRSPSIAAAFRTIPAVVALLTQFLSQGSKRQSSSPHRFGSLHL